MIVPVGTDEDQAELFAAWEQVLAQLAPARVCWHEWTRPTPPLEVPPGWGGQLGAARRATVTIGFGPDEPWPYAHLDPVAP